MTILFTVDEGTAVICIHRPDRANAIDPATAQELARRVQDAESDDAVRCVILTGAGTRHFCAGSDLKAKAAGQGSAITGYGFADRSHSKPCIAAVNGLAVGGGFELALACDFILAVPHARFFLPEAAHGVVASSGGLVRLGRRLPPALATEIAIAGRALSAAEMVTWGLANRVVSPESLLAEAQDLSRTIQRGAPVAVRESLAVLRLAAAESDNRLWERSRLASARAQASPDGKEGPRAFAEGRQPQWTGHWSS
jgi:enoyl-CoA hydratase/carnithine racemase